MKKVLMAGAAVAALLLAAANPQAADVVPEPVMTDWSGFYIGAHAGYAAADMSGCYDCSDPTSALFAEDLDLSGLLGGIHAGLNFQTDDLVIGIEGDVSFTDIGDDGGVIADPGDEDTQSADVDMLASVRLRLGVSLDDVLVYATGGIAIPDAEWTYDDTGGDEDGTVKFNDIGGVAGVGFEFAGVGPIRWRVESLYYFFNESKNIGEFGGAQDDNEIELDDVFVIRGGASYYFNL